MRAAVIVNPVSGPRRVPAARRIELAREALRDLGLPGEVTSTTGPGHATRLARGFVERGVDTIVAWGGDGTINEVGAAMAFRGPALGIVPGGSGNGLARELRLPLDPQRALRIALTGDTRRLDVGELGGRLFFNVAGVGFDAHLAGLFNARDRRGALAYFTSTVRQIVGYRPQRYTLQIGADALVTHALLVVLANSRQYGSNALIAPLARLDDGLLELVVLPALSPVATLWHARRLFAGTVHRLPGVTMRSVRTLDIAGDTLSAFHVDGEVVPATGRISARIHPGAIAVRVG